MSSADEDHFVTTQQFTKTVYRDQYASIDPTSSKLHQTGKVIVITGASKGLGGKGFAPAFAKANAKGIALLSRNAAELSNIGKGISALNPRVQILEVSTDVSSEKSVAEAFGKIKDTFGTADVLINNAGTLCNGTVASVVPADWWRDFEINVKGTFLATQAFLQLIGPSHPATIINITSMVAFSVIPNISSYCLTKLIDLQLQAFVAAENPNVTAIGLHPGIVDTDLMDADFRHFAKDTLALAGGAAVWLTTDEAKFLSGRYVSANWAVDELVERKEEIVGEGKLKVALVGTFGKGQFE